MNLIFENLDDSEILEQTDLFVFSIGYEQRSTHIANKYLSRARSASILPLAFQNSYKENFKSLASLVPHEQLRLEGYTTSREDITAVVKSRIDTIRSANGGNAIVIDVDYSSMPRSWYVGIVKLCMAEMSLGDRFRFWYSHGEYLHGMPEEYPSAGLDSIQTESGNILLNARTSRTHIFGLGFDSLRSNALISILDPQRMFTCYSYPRDRPGFKEKIFEKNPEIISRSAHVTGLYTDDYCLTLAKLKELSYDILEGGSVILVPDGPKPVIIAMSIIPDLIQCPGISSLRISRNERSVVGTDILPTGSISGFAMVGI